MAGKIYMIKENNEFVEMEEKGHAREIDFQMLIKKYPDLIPGDQIDSGNPRKWLLVGSEVNFPIIGGGNIYLDHLFLDQDGIPTLVEIKRREDGRLNREVTSQIIEYGANLLLSTDALLLRSMVESNDDADLYKILNEDDDEDEFWQRVDENLKADNIRLLVVADEIPKRLQNILEFLNRNMETIEILAVEIKQYAKEGITTLVPRVVGQSIEAQSKKARGRASPVLDEKTFFEKLDHEGKKFFGELFKFIKLMDSFIIFRTKGFSCRITVDGVNIKIFEGYSGLAAYGQNLVSSRSDIIGKVNNGDEIAAKYVQEMLKVDGFIPVSNGFKYNIDKNLDDENWNLFKKTISNLIEEIRKNGMKE